MTSRPITSPNWAKADRNAKAVAGSVPKNSETEAYGTAHNSNDCNNEAYNHSPNVIAVVLGG